jgi:hypothetical protein
MNKKVLLLSAALAILPLAGAFAQAQDGFQIFAFDIIVSPTITTPNFDNFTFANTFGLNVRFAKQIIAGFELGSGGTFFNLKYDIDNKLRAGIYLGDAAGLRSGLGMEYVVLNAKSSLATELRLGIRYLWNVMDFESGAIRLSIALGLGV